MSDDSNRYIDVGLTEARNVLIQVLRVLANHRNALVLIGAQAVYEHTVALTWLPPTSTTDADICVDPSLLAAEPLLAAAMTEAGFMLANPDRPGIYSLNVPVRGLSKQPTLDLLAPETIAGKGTRSASVGAHGKRSVTRAAGLEMALLDRSPMTIRSLTDGQTTVESVNVAGVGALLCAKSYKLGERVDALVAGRGRRDRVKPKDAGDVLRLMAVSDPVEVRRTFSSSEDDSRLGPAILLGRRYLVRLFTDGGAGIELAVSSARDHLDESAIRSLVGGWMSAFLH
jgi:hypothetical protein